MPVSVKNIQHDTKRIADQVGYLRQYVNTLTAGGGSGTVTDVSVTTANGVSATVATSTTTPALTFTLGNITPVAVTATGAVTGTNLSGTNTGDQLTFKTIAVSGQSDVVADTATDTLTLAAGSGVTITTNAGTDTITIAASGGGGGGGVSGSGSVSYIPSWNGTTFGDPSSTLTDTLMSIDTGILDVPYEMYCRNAIGIAAGYSFYSGYYSGGILGIIEADEGSGTWKFKSVYGTCVIGDGGAVDFNGTSNTFLNPITASHGVVASLGSISSSLPMFQGSQTWNNVSTAFNGMLIDITNTNSASASTVFDFKVGGTTQLKLRKDGEVFGTGVKDTSASGLSLVKRDENGSILGNSQAWGYATNVTAAGTTSIGSGSSYYQVFTGSTTQTVTLPAVESGGMLIGQSFMIVNQSSGALTVNSSGGNLIKTVAAGDSCEFFVILLTGTTAASWAPVYYSAAPGSGFVTASGSPTSGKFAKWTSATDITNSDYIAEASGRITVGDAASVLNGYPLQITSSSASAVRAAVENAQNGSDGAGFYFITSSGGTLTSQVSLSTTNDGRFRLQGAAGAGAETVWAECSNANGWVHKVDFTFGDATNLVVDTTTGTKIGTATGQKIAFHNSTPVVQRAGASQAAVATTAATNVTPYGFSTQAQADGIITLLNEIRDALVEKGLIKGSA